MQPDRLRAGCSAVLPGAGVTRSEAESRGSPVDGLRSAEGASRRRELASPSAPGGDWVGESEALRAKRDGAGRGHEDSRRSGCAPVLPGYPMHGYYLPQCEKRGRFPADLSVFHSSFMSVRCLGM
jgi:hypothetical protein